MAPVPTIAASAMPEAGLPPTQRKAPVMFTGTRGELFGRLLRGYILMLPTLGIYRFWVTTAKRRYYWRHTVIDGDGLEYTGTALQLLVGFLFAVAFFLPLYILFFYLSTQDPAITLIGYGVLGVLLWFMTGYAVYRARDFRLSRTLWRGIRFGQQGSGWAYAVRRFLWSLLVVVTLGIAYPFMAASLWRYRYNHTWFGDRPFVWTGSWRTIAGPYYRLWLVIGALLAVTVWNALGDGFAGSAAPGPAAVLWGIATLLVLWLGTFYYRAREASRMLSALRIGETRIHVRLKARTLFGQFLLYSLATTGVVVVFTLLALAVLASLVPAGLSGGMPDAAALARLLQSSWLNAAAIILAYLSLIGGFALMAEVFLGWGFWAALARGTTLSNPDDLRSVRSTAEDHALVGEGLADALNVGAY
jgi:uncharacterized membrane protein YjgN (DUF898 family)